jgi:hypothetical protein
MNAGGRLAAGVPAFVPKVVSAERQTNAAVIDASPIAVSAAIASNAGSNGPPDQSSLPDAAAAPVTSAPARSVLIDVPSIDPVQRTDGNRPEQNTSARGAMGRVDDPRGDAASAASSAESMIAQAPAPLSRQVSEADGLVRHAAAQALLSESSAGSDASPASKAASQPDSDASVARLQVAGPLPSAAASAMISGTAAGTSQVQERAFPDQGVSDQAATPETKIGLPHTFTAELNLQPGPPALNAASHVPPVRAWADAVATQVTTAAPKPLTLPATQFTSGNDKPSVAFAASAKQDNPPSPSVAISPAVFVQRQALPIAPVPAVAGSASPMLSNAGNQDATSPAVTGTAGLHSAVDKATSKTADSVSATGDAAQHSTQSNAQASSSAPSDPAHAADAAPKAADPGTAPAQTVAVQAAIPATPATHQNAAVPEAASRAAGQQEAPASMHSDDSETAAASSINSARLMQTVSETEMHVGMRSTEFGDISIRTSVSQQQLVAQIAVDHGGLGQAIAAHVSTMQSKLGEESGLQTSIEVRHLGSALSGEPGQSSQKEQGAFNYSAGAESSPQAAEEVAAPNLGVLAAVGDGSRLDIRA